MLKPVSHLLERLAERCLALAAGSLASTIEAVCLRHQAEQQTQLEDLARSFEIDDLSELAGRIREQAFHITHHSPGAAGETLLRELGDCAVALPTQQSTANQSSVPLTLNSGNTQGAGRRSSGRAKRGLPPLAFPIGEATAPSTNDRLATPPSETTSIHEEGQ